MFFREWCKKGRERKHCQLLDDTEIDESCEKIKRAAEDRLTCRVHMARLAFRHNTK